MARILVVDDEPDILLLIQDALGVYGHALTGAVSSVEAMDYLREQEPDLLILDLRMPDTSGLELLEWVRGRCPDLPIIVCSAVSSLKDEFAVWSSHVAAFISKPIDISRLVREVTRATEGGSQPARPAT